MPVLYSIRNKIVNFVLNHLELSAVILIYLIVLLVSSFFSPWEVDNSALNQIFNDSTNTVTQSLIFRIMLFGICDLYQLFEYATDSGEVGIMFFLSACALFCLQKVVLDNIMDIITLGWFESSLVGFFLDNICAYITSLILFYSYSSVASSIENTMDSGGVIFTIVIGFMIFALIIIPSIPYVVYLLSYIFLFEFSLNILDGIDESLSWYPVFKAPILIIASIGLAIIIDLIVSGIVKTVMILLKDKILRNCQKIT